MNHHPAAALLVGLALAAPAAANDSITTLFNANNGGGSGWGIFFDLEVINEGGLTFNSIAINARNALGDTFQLEVYINETGAEIGNEQGASNSPAGWERVATGQAVAGDNNQPTMVNLAEPFSLEPGTYGVAIRTVGIGQNYTNGTGSNQFYANDDLSLTLGMSRNASTGFGGTMFHPRVWNGTLYYEQFTEPRCIADWNEDGEVDINDFFDYLADFEAEKPEADLNRDGEFDINDLFLFLQAFHEGC